MGDTDSNGIVQRSPSRPHTPNTAARPLTPLSYLSSPAPDLASTLYTSAAAEQADTANVTFLRDAVDILDSLSARNTTSTAHRAHVDVSQDPRRPEYYQAEGRRSMSTQTPAGDVSREEISHRERLQRIAARLNRRSGLATSSSATAYTDRTPSPNRQSLYDWAPAAAGDPQVEAEVRAVVAEVRRLRPDLAPETLRWLEERASEEDEVSRDEARAASASEAIVSEHRRAMMRSGERRQRQTEWVNLRSRAMAQRARQEGEGSPSSTERMLRYVMERERSGLSEEEERARGAGWFRPSPIRGERSVEEQRGSETPYEERLRTRPYTDPRLELERQRERERHERVAAFRRGHLAENGPPQRLPRISTPPVLPSDAPTRSKPSLAEHALKYLSDLRSSTCYEDSLSMAIEHGLATKEWFADKHDEFIMDLSELPSIQESSWLQPGTVFEGHQHATTSLTTLTHPLPPSSRIEQINPNYHPSPGPNLGFDHPPGSTHIAAYDATRPWLSNHRPRSHPPKEPHHDSWPVRVTLHAIDHEKMTIQGTMEAYDVPQHPSSLAILHPNHTPAKAGKKSAPITTYLEGEIIDLKTHTFLTPSTSETQKRKLDPYETSPENRTPYTTLPTTLPFPPANAAQDAANWLRLPPFSTLTSQTNPSQSPPDALARLLLTSPPLSEILQNYIFMRWKERCFIHSTNDPCPSSSEERCGDRDRGHGLTISGFYYVSLGREDGRVEGLYFDPGATPVQWVGLEGRGGGVRGSWGFR